ncbi:unnamed protein product, partial [Ectocarpus sp. 12 AP-2014]
IFAAVLEYSSTDNELSARIFGDISTPAPWTALSYVMSAVISMLVDYPGLRWEGFLKCPQHGNAMLLANKAIFPGEGLVAHRCPHCCPQTKGLGAAAIDLVRTVDIRLDRDEILRGVMERFVVLEDQYSFPRPADSSKDELSRKIDGVATAITDMEKEVKGELEATKAELRDVKDVVKGGLDEVKEEVKDGLDSVQGRLDSVLERTQDSLMRLKNLQAPNYRYPRLVVVSEVGSDGTSSRAHGKRSILSKVRGVGKKDMTLHFMCPVDMKKVPCGYGGEGYRFPETRDWVKRIFPLLQVAAVTAKVALKATSALDVDISDFLKTMKDGLVDELADRTLDEDALLRVVKGEEDIGADMQRVTQASYEALKKFMEKAERSRRKNAKDGDGYIDFRDRMTRVRDGRGE